MKATYKKSYVVPATTGAGANYQIALTVYYGEGHDNGTSVYLNNHSESDFSDVRFYASDGATALSYWIADMTYGTSAKFFVKIPTDISSATATIYLQYGGSDDFTQTTADGASTFPALFQDFEGISQTEAVENAATYSQLEALMPPTRSYRKPVILPQNGTWKQNNVQIAGIVEDPNDSSKRIAYYLGYKDATEEGYIGLAWFYKSNPYVWYEDSSNPIISCLAGEKYVVPSAAISKGGTVYVYGFTSDTLDTWHKCWVWTSSTGYPPFTRQASPVIVPSGDENFVDWCCPIDDGATVYFYYNWRTVVSIPLGIRVASATDLLGTGLSKVGTVLAKGVSEGDLDFSMEGANAFKIGSTYVLTYIGVSTTTDTKLTYHYGMLMAYNASPTTTFTKSTKNYIQERSSTPGSMDRTHGIMLVPHKIDSKWHVIGQNASGCSGAVGTCTFDIWIRDCDATHKVPLAIGSDIAGVRGWTGDAGWKASHGSLAPTGIRALKITNTTATVSHTVSAGARSFIFYINSADLTETGIVIRLKEGANLITWVSFAASGKWKHLVAIADGTVEEFGTFAINTTYKVEVRFPTVSTHTILINDVNQTLTKNSNYTNISADIDTITVESNAGTGVVDDIYGRKYVNPEPAGGTWGAETLVSGASGDYTESHISGAWVPQNIAAGTWVGG